MFAARPIGEVCRSPSVGKNAGALLSDPGWLYLILESFDVHVRKGISIHHVLLLYRSESLNLLRNKESL